MSLSRLLQRVNEDDPSGMKRTEDRRAVELAKDLDAAVKRVLDQVTADSTPAEVKAIVDRELDGYAADTKKKVMEWVEDTQDRAVIRARTIMKGVGIGAVLGPALPLPKEVRDTIAIHVEQDIDSLGADAKRKLTTSLLEGIEAGEGARDLGKRVSEDLAMPRQRAELIARTATMGAFNSTALVEYQRAGVKRVMLYAAMDERVCDQCGALHLKVYDIGDAPSLPLHPRCRCCWIAVAEEG